MSLPARKFKRKDSMEARASVLEAHDEHIKADVPHATAHGFKWI